LNVKPVIPRELASHDIDDIIQYYLDESAAHAALGFVDALQSAP